MRWLGALVFAVAAASSTLAATGLAVPPHIDPPGTPRSHDHLLAAYRYPLFLVQLRLAGEHARGQGWSLEAPSDTELGALVLATLTLLIAALPRPTRRPLERLEMVALPTPQWRPGAPLGPPRAYLRAVLSSDA